MDIKICTLINKLTYNTIVITQQVETPGILSCNETRYFWISWNAGLIEVGRGMRPWDDTFVDWQDTGNYHNVSSISFRGYRQFNRYTLHHVDGMSNQIVPESWVIREAGVIRDKL